MRRKSVAMARDNDGFSRPAPDMFARAQFMVTLALLTVLLLASVGSAMLMTGRH